MSDRIFVQADSNNEPKQAVFSAAEYYQPIIAGQ